MALFAVRRLLLSIPLLIGITFVSYVVIGLAPGGPLDFLTPEDPNASPEVKERLIKEFGLDQPIHVQYWQWLKRAVRLDFGRSFLPDGRPVSAKIAERLPVTLFLNINNLFDNNGPITGGFQGSPGFLYPTPTYADIIGRYFTIGLRVRM